MVGHQINDDVHSTRVDLVEQPFEIVHRAILRVDGVVIDDIVAMIRRRWMNGHQPKRINAK